ncbi:MAG: hypothetical protein Alpg2KO_09990 [Alphaproteobacteria bacterium]
MAQSFQAKFATGATAKLYEVSVALRGDWLLITDNATSNWTRWPLKDIRLVDDDHAIRRDDLIIGESGIIGGRLYFEDRQFQPVLADVRPDLFAQSYNLAEWKDAFRLSSIAAIILLLLAFYGLEPITSGLTSLVPIEKEQQWGKQVEDELFASGSIFNPLGSNPKVCIEPRGRKVLQDVVDRLAAHTPPEYSFTVRVIDSRTENAFALPGGSIFILDGLLQRANTGDEVVGVLAHEMAHVTERHSLKRVIASQGMNALVTAVTGSTYGTQDLINALASSSHSRDDEREADIVGVEFLQKAGIAQDGMVDFFDRLSHQHGGESDILSSHPGHDERREAIADLMTPGQPSMSARDFRLLQDICRDTGTRFDADQPIPADLPMGDKTVKD